ncbi:MAG: hypothetical protein K1Y36_06345 [Blastocatellia bacterium]|nr:hypothetical protein [Blastocatellia bacterium]
MKSCASFNLILGKPSTFSILVLTWWLCLWIPGGSVLGKDVKGKAKPAQETPVTIPDPLKKDIDLNSGVEFPLVELLALEKYPTAGRCLSFPPAKLELAVGSDFPLLKEYGATWVHQRKLGSLAMQVVRFGHPTRAYGAFCALRPGKADALESKHNLWIGKTKALLWVENEVISLSALQPSAETDLSADLTGHVGELLEKYRKWHGGLPNQDPEEPKIPFVVRHLPLDRMDPTTLHCAFGTIGAGIQAAPYNYSEFPLTDGAQLAWADYIPGSAFARLAMCEYPTPQASIEAFKQVEANWNQLPPQERSARLVKRVGNFVVQAYGVTSPARTSEIIEGVKYDYVVQWLGPRPLRSGLDQTTEIRKTGAMLVSIFQLIMMGGVVMGIVGMAAGFGYFYWRRQSSRATAFSDAGGMMRLNLNDNFVLPAPVKLLETKLEEGNHSQE